VLVAVIDDDRPCGVGRDRHVLRGPGDPARRSSPRADKFGKQIRYADRRGIPFVWFPGPDGGGEVKDIRSGDQEPADPDTWAPPRSTSRPPSFASVSKRSTS
jgi:histidyl-tRNA synthetase